jgi:hypothetical protein
LLDLREVRFEVMLQQVFEKTGRDCFSEVFLEVPAPPSNELPHRFWFSSEVCPDPNDGLPPRVNSFGHRLAG